MLAKYTAFIVALIVTGLSLASCEDPNRQKFALLCSANGDSIERCRCTYDVLEKKVGEVDEEFVSFVAHFAKWDLEGTEAGLDRAALMERYDLNEEDYIEIAGATGAALLEGFNGCKAAP